MSQSDSITEASLPVEQVSLDLASFELVRGCTSALLAILDEHLVDVLLANDEEAKAFGR